jgi:hypothetical protein
MQARDITIQIMCFGCWITKPTDSHSEYVMLVDFSRYHRLRGIVYFHCSHRLLSGPHNTKSVAHDTSKKCISFTIGTRNNCIHPALCTNYLTNKYHLENLLINLKKPTLI